MSANKGYLYVLTNPSINGQVKIGRTERHPEDRRKEIVMKPNPLCIKG